MVRLINRTWVPAVALLAALTLFLTVLGCYSLWRQVQDDLARIETLERQVRDLGGNPDEPVTVNIRLPKPDPEPPAPVSPTRRETTSPPSATAAPSSARPSSPPSPSCIQLPVVGGCL